MKINHFHVTLRSVEERRGITSAAPRGCMCCGQLLSGIGGGGYYLCEDCLRMMETGEMADAVHDYLRERLRRVAMP